MSSVVPWKHINEKAVFVLYANPVGEEEKAGSTAGALTLKATSWRRLIGSGPFYAQISKTSS